MRLDTTSKVIFGVGSFMTQRLHRSQHATFDRLGTLPECTQSSLRRERHGDLSITDGGDIIAVAAIRGTIAS